MRIDMPAPVRAAISRLEACGWQAYAVGGCIRDSLLGREPHDWDVTTEALPEQVKEAFGGQKVIETGIRHGTVTLLADGMPIEITTFRHDGAYKDHRRPERVEYVRRLQEDLARRDFTVNAMAYSDRTGMIDCFGGREDLKAHRMRCVGDPMQRFEEDALRIMRCIRFASELVFTVEEATAEAACTLAPTLSAIAMERIRVEFVRLLCGAGAEITLRHYRRIPAVFIPEIRDTFCCDQQNDYHIYSVWDHILHAVGQIEPRPVLRLAAFFHDIGKPVCKTVTEEGWGHFYHHEHVGADMTDKIMRRMKFDNKTREQVVRLVKTHGIVFQPTGKQPARLLRRMGEETLQQLIALERADVKSQAPQFRAERLERIGAFENAMQKLVKEEACFSLRDLAVNGRDLLAAGVPRGPAVGDALEMLLSQVTDGEIANERTALLQCLKEHNLVKD